MSGARIKSQPKQIQHKTHKKISLLEKLQLLQIHGSFKDPRTGSNLRVFDSFPRRLVFRLCDLIEGEDWKSEFTFLGFTRCGQFLLSYSCHYGYDESPLIVHQYIYHMQWWQFVPFRLLKKVQEIRLFGDQEINEDILLAVCQWPTDNTKLLIYGYWRNVDRESESGRWCYLTITAIPPLKPCANCSALNTQDPLSTEDEEEEELLEEDDRGFKKRRKLCLEHSFVVHTRYIRVPPFPAFNPYISMKVDGSVIINTGDNLVVLSLGIQPATETGETAALSHLQPLTVLCEDYDLSSDYFSSPNCPSKPCDDDRWLRTEPVIKRAGKTIDCFKVEDEETKCLKIQLLDNGWRGANDQCFSAILDEDELKNNGLETGTTPPMAQYYKHSEKENISPKIVTRSSAVATVTPRLLSPRERKSIEGKTTDETRALAVPSAQFSGDDTTPVADISNSDNCVSEKKQYFGIREEEGENNPSQFEDDSACTEYHHVLSFEVFGMQCKPMKSLNPDMLPNWKNCAVAVHHFTFDIEQFAHEMAQNICKEAGKKYLAFLDYDVQIIDICEVSQNAIALVLMQVQAMVGQKGVAKELRSSVRKVFQTGFKFEWNINSGNYSIIDTEELNEVHGNAGNLNNDRFWNPASLKVSSLRKDWFIPLSAAKSVRVMTNANVPSGESLKVIWAPAQDAAIVL